MQTKKMNTNKSMRTGVIFAAIAIITLIALIVTFAKYATQGTGEDSARVARWGVNSSIPTSLDLFDASYTGTDGKTTVDSSDGANVVAPGTAKMQTINLASFTGEQAPEVMYHFQPTLTIVDQSTTSSQTISMLDKLNANKAFTWKLVDTTGTVQSFQTYQELQNAVAAMGELDIAPNHFPSNFGGTATPQIKIGWEWDFEYSGTANDPSDTEMGNLSANGTLTGLNTTLTLNAYQCQGCSPTPTTVALHGTVSQSDKTAVDGATVTYSTVTSNDTYTATTHDGGQYSMDVPINSSGTLNAAKEGYTSSKDITVPQLAQDTEINITGVDPIPSGYEITLKTDDGTHIEWDKTKTIDNAISVTTSGRDITVTKTDGTVKYTASIYDETMYQFNGWYYTKDGVETKIEDGQEIATYEGMEITAKSTGYIETPEGIDSTYVGYYQVGVNTGTGYDLTIDESSPEGATTEIWPYNAMAKNANKIIDGEPEKYVARATLKDGYKWKDGSTADYKLITWTVAQAENTTVLIYNSGQSTYQKYSNVDQSAEFQCTLNDTPRDASGDIEGFECGVTELTTSDGATEQIDSNANFEFESVKVGTTEEGETLYKFYVIRKANTPVGTYNLKLWFKSGGGNYKEKVNPSSESTDVSFTWYVTNPTQIHQWVNGVETNFLPAYDGDTCPYTFYKKNDDETYTELGEATGIEITDMSSLASAINKAGVENVYTDDSAKGATFYGTFNRSWNDTFTCAAGTGYADGLNSDFKTIIENAGVKTVYGDYDDEGNWVEDGSHNWNRSTDTQPDLNSVYYSSFYGAYNSLLSGEANFAWSSRACDDRAFTWSISFPGWVSGRSRTSEAAVVLSREF